MLMDLGIAARSLRRSPEFRRWSRPDPLYDVVAGVVLGIVSAIGTMRLMEGLLYGTTTRDVVVYAAVSAPALVLTLAASLLPAARCAGRSGELRFGRSTGGTAAQRNCGTAGLRNDQSGNALRR
jgi:hypothetical protein